MHKIKTLLLSAALAATATSAVEAQEALRSGYFLEGYNYRHELNPAFAPERNYFALPVVGNLNLTINTNMGMSTFLYPVDGQLATFLHPAVSAKTFLDKLQPYNTVAESLRFDILNIGFRSFGGYTTLSAGLRQDLGVSIPKGLFSFIKQGQDGPNTTYSFTNLGMRASMLGEVALGHSHQLSENLRIGAKLKLLIGVADLEARISQMDIAMGDEEWSVKANGELNIATGTFLVVPTYKESGQPYESPSDANLIDLNAINVNYGAPLQPSGMGGAVDLGITYTPTPFLELSAAITDLGVVDWEGAMTARTDTASWQFTGFKDVAMSPGPGSEQSGSIDEQISSLTTGFEGLMRFRRTSAPFTRRSKLDATMTLGAKITVCPQISAGLLITKRNSGIYTWEEGRVSLNLSPVGFLDLSASAAKSTFGNTLGWLFNFHPAGLNLFVGTDWQFYHVTPQYLPIDNTNLNINAGITFTFGAKAKKRSHKSDDTDN